MISRQQFSRACVVGFGLISAVSIAHAQCMYQINQCQTITSPGTYCAGAFRTQLYATDGDCLIIAAPNVSILPYNDGGVSAYFFGTGTGAAIHILKRATNFYTFFFCGDIQNFAVGIQDDADKATVTMDYDCPLFINDVNTGVVFNHVTGSQFEGITGGVQATENGLVIRGGSNNYVYGGSSFSFNPSEYSQAGVAGIRINNSHDNTIFHIETLGAKTGIDVKGDNNQITQSEASQNEIGIRVKGTGNIISHNTALNNLEWDLYDGDKDCGGNTWMLNTFNAANQDCVH